MTQGQVFNPVSLQARGLSCGRGGLPLVTGLDLDLGPGEALLLQGPNGTGKTTLLLTLAGLVEPLAGSVTIAGNDDAPALHHCGHRNALKARLSCRENLRFWQKLNGAEDLGVDAALERVGLGDLGDLDAGYLSAGQSRRLALARLLVSPRPLWLLDEPTAALDRQGHGLVEALLATHLERGGLAIVATHDALAVAGARTLHLKRAT